MLESMSVKGLSRCANLEASKLCWQWNQAAVLVFKESPKGKTARFTFDDVDRKVAERAMRRLGIRGDLIEGSRLITFATDRGEQDAIEELGAALSTRPRRTLGSVRIVIPRAGGVPAKASPSRRRAGVPRRLEPWFAEAEARTETSEVLYSDQAPVRDAVHEEAACRYCDEGRVAAPLSDHFEAGTNRAWHTPWFGYLLPCPGCRERGRGPKVIMGDEDGGWSDPELPRLTHKPARPGHTTVIFLGSGQRDAMRALGKQLAEERKRAERLSERGSEFDTSES